MEIIIEKYRLLIEKLIKEFGNESINFHIKSPEEFEIIRQHLSTRSSPFVPAIAHISEKIICFQDRMDSDSSKQRIKSIKRERLITDEDYVRHLTLHEVAHIVNNWLQDKEDDCDEWAFTKMGIIAPL